MRPALTTTLLMTLLAAAAMAAGPPPTYGLRDILTGVVYQEAAWGVNTIMDEGPEATAEGGRFRYRVRYSDACAEGYEVDWSFDPPLHVLAAGASTTLQVRHRIVTPTCEAKRDPYVLFGGTDGRMVTLPSKAKKLTPAQYSSQLTQGSTGRLYAKGLHGPQTAGVKSVPVKIVPYAEKDWVSFALLLETSTGRVEGKARYGSSFELVYLLNKGYDPRAGGACLTGEAAGTDAAAHQAAAATRDGAGLRDALIERVRAVYDCAGLSLEAKRALYGELAAALGRRARP